MSNIFFVLNNLLAINAACWLAKQTSDDRGRQRYVLFVLIWFVLICYSVVMVAGLLGKLIPEWITFILVILHCLLFSYRKYRYSPEKNISMQTEKVFFCFINKSDRYQLFALLIIAGIGTLWAAKGIYFGSDFSWDDFSYHAAIPAQWVVQKKIFFAPYPYQTYYPFNAEIFSLWFLLPYGCDAFVSLAGTFWGTIAAVSMFVLMSSMGCSFASSCLIAALFLSSPSVQKTAQTFSANDLAAPAMMIAALAVACGYTSPSRQEQYVDAFCAGLLVGFAAGIKVSFLSGIFVIGIAFMLSRFALLSLKDLIACSLLFLTGVTMLSGFWYGRNIALTGNPLFPAEWFLFKGPLTRNLLNRSKLIWWFLENPLSLRQNMYILKSLLDWPVLPGLLACIGYASGLYSLFFLRRNLIRRKPEETFTFAIVIFSGLIMLALFPLMPFSGTHEEPHGWLIVENRYIVFSYAIGLISFAMLLKSNNHARFALTILAIIALLSALCHYSKKELIIFCCGGFGIIVILLCLTRVALINISFGLTVCALILSVLLYPIKKKFTDINVFCWGQGITIGERIAPSPGAAWKVLETLPPGSHIGFFANNGLGNLHYYPAFGRNLQHLPMPLRNNGLYEEPLHVTWDWWGQKDRNRAVEQKEFMQNLQKGSVSYIIMTQNLFKDTWPKQKEYLDGSDVAEKIFDNGWSAIWKIMR